ncbi:MAG: hypothetical protein M3Y87_18865 [Myxococcota bacterium]|nr:hypothetical protein [Myxococcota bacterium]
MDTRRLGLAGIFCLLAAASGCDATTTPAPCECAIDVPEGRLDARCGERTCVGGAGYRCTEPGIAVADPIACAMSDAGTIEVDGGVPEDGGRLADPDASSCADRCVPRSSQCTAGVIATCEEDARGCWALGRGVACESGACADAQTCAACTHECARAGQVECASGVLRSCVVGSAGCLEWSSIPCPEGFCGDVRSCGSCDHTCAAEGVTECSSGVVRSCVADARGCRSWSAGMACAEGFCGDATTCGTCTDRCASPGVTECVAGTLRTCAADARGCLDWSAGVACADGFCGDAVSCGSCAHGCATLGATECTAGSSRTCIADARGCRSWGAPSSCADGFCADAFTCGACVHECAAAGVTCASGDVATCSVDAMGCRYETRAECGTSCGGTGVCASCPMHHDPIVATHAIPSFSGRQLVRVGSLVYVPTGTGGLRIVDVSTPSAPVDVGGHALRAEDVAIVGSHAVVVGYGHGLSVLDVSTPSSPTLVASVALAGNPEAIEIAGGYAYVLGDDLQVVDLRTIASPTLVATHGTPGYGSDLVIIGSRLFLSDSVNGIRVVDVSVPTAPTLLGAIGLEGASRFYGLEAIGTQLLAVTFVGFSPVRYELRSFDTAATGFPRTGSLPLDIRSTVVARVTVVGSEAYVVAGSTMLEVVDVSDPAHPSITGRVTCGGSAVIDAGDGRHLVCARGTRLDVVDLAHGARHLAVTPVSDPESLVLARGLLFVAGDGLSIFDVSDPASPALVSRYTTAQTYDVAVAGELAYVAYYGRAEIVSIADPRRPTLVATMTGTANQIAITGGHAYVRGSSDVAVWDVRVPSAPVRVATLTSPSSAPNSVVASGNVVVVGSRYAIDAWMVTTPSAPVVAGTLAGGGRVLSMHGTTFYAVGDGWTSGDDFFRIVDASDPTSPTIIGQLPTYDPDGFTAAGGYGYALRDTELSILDLRAPATPVVLDRYYLPGTSGSEDVAVNGAYVFANVNDAVVAVHACR